MGFIILLSVGLFNLFQNPDRANANNNQIAFSKFLEEVDNGRVVQVEIQGNNIKKEPYLMDQNFKHILQTTQI